MTPLQAYLNSPRVRRALSKTWTEVSLIELVVVVAVLAVLSAIAIPSFTNISGKARATQLQILLPLLQRVRCKNSWYRSGTHQVPNLAGYNVMHKGSIGGTKVAAGSTGTCMKRIFLLFRMILLYILLLSTTLRQVRKLVLLVVQR